MKKTILRKLANKSSKKPKKLSRTLKEQGPNFYGTPTFSGTGNYGHGGYKQLAHFGLNPATQEMVDKEQAELDDNIDQQAWSLPGKGRMGTPSLPEPHWDGRNGSISEENDSLELEEQISTSDNSVSRMKDLPGFPRLNSLVNPKPFVPANDSPNSSDPITGKKLEFIGPTLYGKPLEDISPEEQEEMIGPELHEMLGAHKATHPERQGWNNTKINSLALRKNHINPEEPPPEMWRPLFIQPEGPHNPRLTKDPMDSQDSSSATSPRASKTPAWSMGSIGYPKQHVPEDYEQANDDYEDIIKDPIGSRRLQIPSPGPLKEKQEKPLEVGKPGPGTKATKKGHWASVKPSGGSLEPSGMGGAKAFSDSRKKVLQNLIEVLVEEIFLQEQNQTVAPKRRVPGAPTATQPVIAFNDFHALLKNKKPEELSSQEVSRIINFVASKKDLKQEFHSMQEKEIQNLEVVLDRNIDNEKIGPFASKVELARGTKHLSQTNQPKPPPVPQVSKKPSAGPGAGPAQKISLPKQALSKDFTAAVKQKYDQITNAQGLSKQQRERLLQQLGTIQFAPEGSEDSKLRRIDDLVKSNLGTRVEFPTSQPHKTIPQTGMIPPQQQSGFLGKAKSFLGLNELELSELSLKEALREED